MADDKKINLQIHPEVFNTIERALKIRMRDWEENVSYVSAPEMVNFFKEILEDLNYQKNNQNQ